MLFWANTSRNNTIKGDIGRAGSETSVKENVNKHNIFQAQEAGVFFFFFCQFEIEIFWWLFLDYGESRSV